MIDSEGCRFVLAHYRQPYSEEPHVFGWASLLALWHGYTIQIPLLYGKKLQLAGPKELVDHFDKTCPPELKLIPTEKPLADQVAADWERFNTTLAGAVAVFAYYHLLPHRELMFEPFTRGGPDYERSFLGYGYPALAGLFKLLLKLNAERATNALAIIRSSFDEVDKQLKDGRRYMVGDRLTLSDIALATAAAPILLPAGFGSPMPTLEQMPPEMVSIITEMRQRDTAKFIERIYRDHRNGHFANDKGAGTMAGQPSSTIDVDIATPRGNDGIFAFIRTQGFLAFLARLALVLSPRGSPLKIGSFVIAARHRDVSELLSRDLDFLIAPINEQRMREVRVPFILGMDRGTALAAEREALYTALAQVDRAKLAHAVAAQADERIAAAKHSLDVVGDYARPIAAQTARAVFGLTGQDDRLFMDVARAIFAHTFLNIGGDEKIKARALKAADLLKTWFDDEIKRRRASQVLGDDMMGALLRNPALDDDGVRRSLSGMLVGAIDTTATAVAKIVTVIGKNSRLREQMRADCNNAPRLTMWCLEALRCWPHNPLVLRRAAADTMLGETEVKAGDTVVALTEAAMFDPEAFPKPKLLTPDRPRAAYLHYGGGLHPCAGRAINDFQITTLVGKLLARGIDSVGSMTWAGSFPDLLVVQFARRHA